jgi:hypothetical protein
LNKELKLMKEQIEYKKPHMYTSLTQSCEADKRVTPY